MAAPSSRANLKVRSRAFMLTWSKTVLDVDPIEGLRLASEFAATAYDRVAARFGGNVSWIGACPEKHADQTWHCHCFVVLDCQKDWKIGVGLDIGDRTVCIKSHPWKFNDVLNGMHYIHKECEEPIIHENPDDLSFEELCATWGLKADEDTSERELKGADTVFRDALAAPGLDEAKAIIRDGAPRDYVLNYTKILFCLEAHFTKPFVHKYLEFSTPFIEWDTLDVRETLVLTGPPKMGKTSWALAHFKKPLLVRHIDDLKSFNPSFDGIVFDEINLKKWIPSSVKVLLDREYGGSVHCRHHNGKIPPGFPRVVCVNDIDDLYPENCSAVDRDAIGSRIHHIYVDAPLF